MAPTSSITVAVGRFEDLVARGVRAVLAEDPALAVVAWDVDHDALGATLAAHDPTVALLDLASLPSPVALHGLVRAHPLTRVVVLATAPTTAEADQTLAFGATACLSKDCQARDLLHAIHLAARGMRLVAGTTPPQRRPEVLTAREADVLALLRNGVSNAEIAADLHVGVETVRTHVRHIYRKLGVRSRRELSVASRS